MNSPRSAPRGSCDQAVRPGRSDLAHIRICHQDWLTVRRLLLGYPSFMRDNAGWP